MSSLLELTQNYFLGSTGHQTSLALEEPESNIRLGLQSAVPLVLGALLVRAQRPGGAAELATQARQVYGRGLLGDLRELLASLPRHPAAGAGITASQRLDLLHALLESNYPAAVAGISQQAGLRSEVVDNVLRVVVAVGLGLLGRHATQQNLSAAELASYLASQRESIGHAVNDLPSTISGTLPALLGGPARITAQSVLQASDPVDQSAISAELAAGPVVASATLAPPTAPTPTAGDAGQVTPPRQQEVLVAAPVTAPIPLAERSGSPSQVRPAIQHTARSARRWPWLLGLLALALLGYVEWGRLRQPTQATLPAPEAPATPAPVELATGHYEAASDTYRYDPGDKLVEQLPTGAQLRTGKNTAETQLFYQLTNSPKVQPDPSQAGICLDQIGFAAGTATLTAASQAQLTNLVTLLKAFPKAQLKIGGFTDNQGAAEASLLLSADRANAVRKVLLSQGIAPNRVAAQGYGQTHPVVSNDTQQGRAQNRRVAILLLKK